MRTQILRLAAVLALCLLPAGAKAVSFTFEGTTPDTSIDVKFIADLSISGDDLTLVLTNDSLNHVNGASSSVNPNDLLTSFYFDVFNGTSRPTLTYTGASGDVCLTSSGGTDNCGINSWPAGTGPPKNAGLETDLRAIITGDATWQFRDSLTLSPGADTLTFGVGTSGNNTLLPNGFNGDVVDGMDYGLYAGDVTTINLNNMYLTTGSIVFTWSGASSFTDADIGDEVLFGLGTKPDSTAFVPEPSTGLLVGMGLFALAWHGRRK